MRRSTPGMGEAFHGILAACTDTRSSKFALRSMSMAFGSTPDAQSARSFGRSFPITVYAVKNLMK